MIKFFKTKYDNIITAMEMDEKGEKKPVAIIARVDSAISSGLVSVTDGVPIYSNWLVTTETAFKEFSSKEEAKEYVRNHADNLEEFLK